MDIIQVGIHVHQSLLRWFPTKSHSHLYPEFLQLPRYVRRWQQVKIAAIWLEVDTVVPAKRICCLGCCCPLCKQLRCLWVQWTIHCCSQKVKVKGSTQIAKHVCVCVFLLEVFSPFVPLSTQKGGKQLTGASARFRGEKNSQTA